MTSAALSTLLRDAIDIPLAIRDSDFVLQIDRAQEDPAQTLGDYVVTESIAEAIDKGLGLADATLSARKSNGAFIHGSFGAGKSHYMAVLHLLLTGDPRARAVEGLQDVVAKHASVLSRNLLAVDYHFVGAESVESALFGGYLKTVKAKHPDADAPVLHRSDALLENADQIRAQIGDEAFFAKFPAGSGGRGGGFGSFGSDAVTPAAYDAARRARPGDPARQKVVAALIKHWFPSFENTGSWLDISAGLEAMTGHAKSLGYDGVVLFLDELVLWLSSHLGNSEFVNSEISKIAKLVETGAGTLPVPLVSFVARQRNLADFLGSNSGAEKEALDVSFQWWEGRFEKIDLPAANLPQIVQRRLLTPTSDAGRSALDAAVAKVKANPVAYRHLLTDDAGSGAVDFEQVYPFSPALVDAMIALSTVMQRERTALKLMSELLSQGREELTVGDVIGVGDLFDVAVLGDTEPLTPEMQSLFKSARAFYSQKMRPYLLAKHGVSDRAAKELPRGHQFRRDDRIAKTLLVAAIVPAATSLKDMTASKLAALNYGSVVSMLPGQEASQVVLKAKEWAGEFGEISVGHHAGDPLISLKLSGIDLDSILVHVQNEDNGPNQRTLLREIVAGEIGAEASGKLGADYSLSHVWRGQRREVDVVFGNIRDTQAMPTATLLAADGRWRLVVDYPFDDLGRPPTDDIERLGQLKDGRVVSDTIAWVPHFITATRMADVGKLVQLEYLLTGSRFDQYSTHLAVTDREPARSQLSNQRDSLREQVRAALRQAYGIDAVAEDQVGAPVPDGRVFHTLASDYDPLKPAAASLRQAVEKVLNDALDARSPAHPKIDRPEDEVRRPEVNAVLDLARRAMAAGGRIEMVERPVASKVRRVVDAYGIGSLSEVTYVLDPVHFRWQDAFVKAASGGDPSVADLRGALSSYGMTADVQDLLVLAWGAMADRSFRRHGNDLGQPGLGGLWPDVVLQAPVLPSDEEWEQALVRAKALFGIGSDEYHLSSAAVGRVGKAVVNRVNDVASGVEALVRRLEEHAQVLGLDDVSPRLSTARRARDLCSAIKAAGESLAVVQTVAEFDLPSELPALAKSMNGASEVAAAISGAAWGMLDQLPDLGGDQADSALQQLRSAAAAEEFHTALGPVLKLAAESATAVLVERRRAHGPTTEEIEAQRQAAARRAAEEERLAEIQRREAQEQQAKLAQRQRELEAEQERLRKQQEEFDRRQREADDRAKQVYAFDVDRASDLEKLLHQLVEQLQNPVEGKRIRVEWRWE